MTSFEEAFIDLHIILNLQRELKSCTQENRPVSTYAAEFKRISLNTGFNEAALITFFKIGLNLEVKDQLAQVRMPATLDRLISLSSTIDQKLQERHLERRLEASSHNFRYSRPAVTHFAAKPHFFYNFSPKLTTSPSLTVSKGPENQPTGPTPIEVDAITHQGLLSQVKKDRRHKEGLCLYCREPDHHSLSCPNKDL